MLNAGSVLSRRFNSNGPERVIQNFEMNNPPLSPTLSEYVKALVSVDLQAQGRRCFLAHVSFKLLLFFSMQQ